MLKLRPFNAEAIADSFCVLAASFEVDATTWPSAVANTAHLASGRRPAKSFK